MANEYLKPQKPLKDLNSENYFYPLTTSDQVFLLDTTTRLSSLIDKTYFTASRAIYYNGTKLLSSNNIFLNDSLIGINRTSLDAAYKFSVVGNSLFNGILYFANGTTYFLNNSADTTLRNITAYSSYTLNTSTATDSLAMRISTRAGTSSIGTNNYTNTTVTQNDWAQIYYRNPILRKVYETAGDTSSAVTSSSYFLPYWWFRLWSVNTSNGARTSYYENYSLPATDNNRTTNASYKIITTKNLTDADSRFVTLGTALTITAEKTFTTNIVFNKAADLGIIQSYYSGTKYNVLRDHNNGNVSLSAESGDLYLGYTNTGTVHTTKALKIDGGMNWPAPQNIICSYTANNQECSFDLTPGDYTGCYWHVWSAKSSASILLCFADNRHVAIPVHLYVGGYNNTSYGLSTNSFICNSWVRTVGATGWYNESYGGGWYMADTSWIRNYGSKAVYLNNLLRIDSNLNVGTSSTTGNIWCGTYKDTAHGEHQVGVASGAGRLYIYSLAAATANRGLYGANNAGTNASYLYITQDNYLRAGVRLYGAVWNDYAEFRKGQMDNLKPGQVVTENGNGTMQLANQKLLKGCKILSDTYGFALGETDEYKLPIAVSGRVLIYCDTPNEELEPGDCLCANYTGNAIKMTQEEIIKYPDRIIATVSEFPNYEIWHAGDLTNPNGMKEEVKVNGRIWVYVR